MRRCCCWLLYDVADCCVLSLCVVGVNSCLLSIAKCWILLVVRCVRLLFVVVVVCWLLIAGSCWSLLVVGCSFLGVGCLLLSLVLIAVIVGLDVVGSCL